jgi:hypothetical protein
VSFRGKKCTKKWPLRSPCSSELRNEIWPRAEPFQGPILRNLISAEKLSFRRQKCATDNFGLDPSVLVALGGPRITKFVLISKFRPKPFHQIGPSACIHGGSSSKHRRFSLKKKQVCNL